jgi:5'-3' exonuclease
MGIKGLYNFIIKNSKVQQYIRHQYIKNLSGKTVAIDSMIYIYKFNNFVSGSLPYYWTQFILTLIAFDIHPIFIFDSGEIPDNKKATVEIRYKRRQRQIEYYDDLLKQVKELASSSEPLPLPSEIADIERFCTNRIMNVNSHTMNVDKIVKFIEQRIRQAKGINKDDLNIIFELNRVFGVEYYIAPGESDKLCAALYHNGTADFVMSDDSDMIAYQCNVIKEFNMFTQKYVEIIFSDILNGLHMTTTQFTDLCVLSGTDYSKPVANIEYIYNELVKKKQSFDSICDQKTIDDEMLDTLYDTRETWLDFDMYANISEYRYIEYCNLERIVECIKIHIDPDINEDDVKILKRLVYACA